MIIDGNLTMNIANRFVIVVLNDAFIHKQIIYINIQCFGYAIKYQGIWYALVRFQIRNNTLADFNLFS